MMVLVTGATGFLGSHLTVALRDSGVVATGRDHRKLAKLSALGVQTVSLDLSNPIAACDRDKVGPMDAIVHCASLSSPWGAKADFVAANQDATRHVADLAAELGVTRFVQVSTASVYFQFRDQDEVQEDALPPAFVNDYARTKRAAELEVLSRSEIGPVILRPRGIYGAGDTALLPRLLRVARHRPLPKFAPAGATDMTHVDDVVGACRAALLAGPDIDGGIFNISGGVGIALPTIIDEACARVGVAPRWRSLPFAATRAATRAVECIAGCLPGRPEPPVTAYALGILRYRQTLNIDKAAKRLNWHPKISFDEGLARTFAQGTMRAGVL